jgi:phosphonate transport system substrate-binding protein
MHLVILLSSLILLLVAACGPANQPYPAITLSDLEPLPAYDTTVDVVPLRVAIAAIISPQGTAESYAPLLDYLGTRLGRPVELVQRRTYAEVNNLIERGEVDLAFVCTKAYVMGHRDFGMELVAAPQMGGETVYHSVLIVPAESPARSMADLRGLVFAFTDPLSNTGCMYPTHLVQQLGETPAAFFERTLYTYSHDDAIRAVAEGLADGAAVDSLVYEFTLARTPELGQRTRIIHRSPPFGMPPAVVNPNIRPQLRAQLREILLQMDGDPQGREALATAGFDRFVQIEDDAYDSVRDLEQQVGPLQ